MKVIILAGGKGKRMQTDQPKVLAPFRGKTLLTSVLDSVMEAGIDPRPTVVIGYQGERVEQALAGYQVKFVTQEQQLGTGHAVSVCRPHLDRNEPVLVLCGDQPLITAETLRMLAESHAPDAAITMVTYMVPDFEVFGGAFASFGRIIRDAHGQVRAIREAKDATPQELAKREINPAFYVFNGPWLWSHIDQIHNKNAQGEYYLTDLVAMGIEEGSRIEALVGHNLTEAIGVNAPEHLALAEQLMTQPDEYLSPSLA